MSAEHWRRPLRDGGVQFLFRAPDGEGGTKGAVMDGSITPGHHVDVLRAMFEQVHGCKLPDPEMKLPLGLERSIENVTALIASCHERRACPLCGAPKGTRCWHRGLPHHRNYRKPLKHPHEERWTPDVPKR